MHYNSKAKPSALMGVIGLVVVLFTLAAFFLLDIERGAIQWTALGFLLLSELVLFSWLRHVSRAEEGNVFLTSGMSTALGFYFLTTLVSVFFVGLFQLSGFVLLQLGIIALFAVLAFSLLAASRRIRASQERTFAEMGFLQAFELRVHTLLAKAQGKAEEEPLREIYETAKFSDKVGRSSLDGELETALTRLESLLCKEETPEGAADKVAQTLAHISSLLRRRKAEIGASKRGSF